MIDKTYYTTKQQKLEQKIAKIKDQFVADSLNMAERLSIEIKEIQQEYKEIQDIILEGEKETKIPIKKK